MSLLTFQMICLSLGQFARTISLPPSKMRGVMSVLLKIEFEIAIFFDDMGYQIKVNGTFITVTSFVLHNNKLFTVKSVTNSFTCS